MLSGFGFAGVQSAGATSCETADGVVHDYTRRLHSLEYVHTRLTTLRTWLHGMTTGVVEPYPSADGIAIAIASHCR